MGFLIGFLSFVMVLVCVVLTILVLIQLPKKEAGAGLAFGGGATDALFGAGSGNVLTKITKWAAGIFFALAIVLAMLQKSYHGQNTAAFEQGAARSPVTSPGAAVTTTPLPPANQLGAKQPTVSPLATNAPVPVNPPNVLLPLTNAPANKPAAEQPAPKAAATNAAPAPAAPK